MLKRLMLLLGVLALALSGLLACRSSTPEATTPEPSPTNTATAPTSPVATKAAEDTTSPTPSPTWQIPEVRADDWVRGGANAGLTLVEYSDFQ